MKRTVKQAVEALRSGEYKQGTDFLTQTNKKDGECDCCLGVISKICPKAPVANWVDSEKTKFLEYGRERNAISLTEVVQNWIGFKTDVGTYNHEDLRKRDPLLAKQIDMLLSERGMRQVHLRTVLSLAELNDYMVPFKVIAAVMEAEPEGLFK